MVPLKHGGIGDIYTYIITQLAIYICYLYTTYFLGTRKLTPIDFFQGTRKRFLHNFWIFETLCSFGKWGKKPKPLSPSPFWRVFHPCCISWGALVAQISSGTNGGGVRRGIASKKMPSKKLGGFFPTQIFCLFSPRKLFGAENPHFDEHICSEMGWFNHTASYRPINTKGLFKEDDLDLSCLGNVRWWWHNSFYIKSLKLSTQQMWCISCYMYIYIHIYIP